MLLAFQSLVLKLGVCRKLKFSREQLNYEELTLPDLSQKKEIKNDGTYNLFQNFIWVESSFVSIKPHRATFCHLHYDCL